MNSKNISRLCALSLLTLFAFPAQSDATQFAFGGDTTGVTQIQWNDSSVLICPATSDVGAGNLDSAIMQLHANWKGPHTVNFLIYNSDSTLLDTTNDFTVTTSAATRYKADFVGKAAIQANSSYLIGIHLASEGGTNGAIRIVVLSGGTTPTWRYKLNRATIPATWATDATTGGYPFTLFLFYSSSDETPTRWMIVISGDNQ
jgi:hypothetical protein